LARPEDLRRVLALLAGLEIPPPGSAPATAARPPAEPQGYDPREYIEEPFDPEGRAPARPSNRPDRGDAWEPPLEGMKDEGGRMNGGPAGLPDSSFSPHPFSLPTRLPTPRADAFRSRLPPYRGHWTRRQLVAWRQIVLEEILGQIQGDRPV
jgi:hypothetical protein